MCDFIMITRSSPRQDSDAFQGIVQRALGAAKSAYPEIEWRADFTLNPRECVEVFSAPSMDMAMRMSHLVRAGGIDAEVLPLRGGW